MEDLQQEYAQQVEEQVQGSGIGIQGNAAKSSEAAPDKDSKRWVKLDLEKRFINSGEGIPVDLGLLQAAADLIYSKKRIMCGFAESEIANLTERLLKAEQAMRAAPALRALPERLEAAVIWETTLVEACVCAGLESDDFASLPERIREWRRKAEKRGEEACVCAGLESEIDNLTERLLKAEQAMRAAPALRDLRDAESEGGTGEGMPMVNMILKVLEELLTDEDVGIRMRAVQTALDNLGRVNSLLRIKKA